MQTLTIKIDDSYVDQVLNFLKQIPDNKKEIFQHTTKKRITSNDFLTILANGPTISKEEVDNWEQQIKKGYNSWKITEF